MKILAQNYKKGHVFLQTENLDDLWTLTQIVEPSDKVKSITTRKLKLGTSEKATKKTIMLSIEVDKVEFSKTSSCLRISGKVLEGSEDIPKSSHHTITIEENSKLSINKNSFPSYQIEKIKEASKDSSLNILICVMERDNASFALLKRHGYEHLLDLQGEVQHKRSQEKIKKSSFYPAIIKKLEDFVSRFKINKIILASPAFFKEDLVNEIKDKNLKSKISLATCNNTGSQGINEVLKRDEIKSILKEERIYKETMLVEKLLKHISTDELANYGPKQVENAISAGAVKILLLTDGLIIKSRNENFYNKLERIMKTADSMQAEVHIISSENEAGKKLDSLTGIAAILRYKIT